MQALVIHAPKDLRIEPQQISEPGFGQVAIAIKAGGVCGSDLHYYHHGGFGAIRLQEPMVPGHEVAGEVVALGSDVNGLQMGDLVAVNPSLPCLQCEYCEKSYFNHCLEMRFYGSAMRFPHVQGAFCQHLICEARQCVVMPADTDPHHGAFAEPLSVALHGVSRAITALSNASSLSGQKVFVSGCGPIGLLTLMAARHGGAAEIVAADVSDYVLGVAMSVGADKVVNAQSSPEQFTAFKKIKGYFDIVFEASGQEPAIHQALSVLRPRGTLVQLGLGGDINLPMNLCVAKEIQMLGSFRFHEEFAHAAELIGQREIDVSPLLSAKIKMEDAVSAFELAGDRSKAIKVQIAF